MTDTFLDVDNPVGELGPVPHPGSDRAQPDADAGADTTKGQGGGWVPLAWPFSGWRRRDSNP